MKNKIYTKVAILVILTMLCSFSISYGKTNSYILNDEYIFEVTEDIPARAYVNILVGKMDATTYSDGNMKISPFPNEIKEDEFGNKMLRYTHSSLAEKKGDKFVVSIEKHIKTNDKQVRYDTNLIKETITKYLSATPKIESNNQYIIAKAEELTKDCETDYDKMKNIFEYVNMYLTYDTSSTYRNKGALSALLTGRGVCEEYVTLFISLCRACDIPARAVTGYHADPLVLGQKTESISMYHTWPEVYIEGQGWVPLEITAEYYVNGKKEVYWPGFLSLGDQTKYVVEGLYNSEANEIEWYGVNFDEYNKYITLTEEKYFLDINEHWAKTYIENLYKNKIINGYEDGTFLPDNNVTRAEYICMLSRTLKQMKMEFLEVEDIYYTTDFEDNWVKEDYDNLMKYYAFYAQDVENGAGSKTINYVFGDTFNMNEPIKREEVVALLAPFLKQIDEEQQDNQEDKQEKENEETMEESEEKQEETESEDKEVIEETQMQEQEQQVDEKQTSQETVLIDIEDSKFKKEIITSYINNIIVGYEDYTFKPNNTITRGEIATIFDRMITKEK